MISSLRNVFTADVHIRSTSRQPPCGLCSYGHTNHFAFLDMLHTYSFGQGFYMIQDDAYTRRIHILENVDSASIRRSPATTIRFQRIWSLSLSALTMESFTGREVLDLSSLNTDKFRNLSVSALRSSSGF